MIRFQMILDGFVAGLALLLTKERPYVTLCEIY
ncbi:MAG: hypothetical protein ACI8PD_001391, partial [Nitrospinales bacterium]